jgi:hypothetical protein
MAQKFTITAELNLQTKNLSQVVNNLKQQFQGANLNIKIKDLAQAEASVRNISKSAKDAQGSFNSLGSSIASAAKKFTAVTLATGTFVGLARAVKGAIGDAVEFEREMVKIAQATGKTVAQLQALRSEIGSVASGFGVSSKELIEAARNLTQAGFAADKVTGALKLLAQTELAATFDSIGDTTEGVIALLNQFGREAQRTGSEIDFLEKSLSAINQVSKEYAVESSDLITAIRTTGSAFETAGGSLNELIALFTSVRSTTRESAESISTGFRTIFTRTQRLDTINNLKKLGIELQDAEGKFVGPMEATKRLSIALSSIDPKDFRFNLIVEQLGGFRQVSKVIPLIQQFGVAQKALNVAQGSSGSLAKDAQTAQQSLAVQIQKTREEFSRFIRDLTESKAFKDTAKFLLDMANAFIKVADVLKPLIPMMAGFASIKIGQALLPGLKSLTGSAQKRHEGGKIHAFASGGMVPGSGNGDTVPAMLTPGEFVIRKSSVKKLGADNLAHANKYAGGGPIQYYEEGSDGGVKKNDTPKQKLSAFNIYRNKTPRTSLNTHFTHLKKLGTHSGNRLYDNLGIDLPASWNLDWDDAPNNVGPTSEDFANYIKTHDIFTTLTKKKSLQPVIKKGYYRDDTTGKSLRFQHVDDDIIDPKTQLPLKYEIDPKTGKILLKERKLSSSSTYKFQENRTGKTALNFLQNQDNADKIKNEFSSKVKSINFPEKNRRGDKQLFDTDADVIRKNIGDKLLDSVKEVAPLKTTANAIEASLKLVTAAKIGSEGDRKPVKSNRQRNKLTGSTSSPDDIIAFNDKASAQAGRDQILKQQPQFAKKYASQKALGGLIQHFALGGPAGKSRAARAITIPRIDSYTFDKPAGADLDATNPQKQQYKLNAEDRLDYDVNNVNVDVNKLKVSKGLLEQYNTADDQKRGYRFEDILKETGMAKSLSQVSNARLDGITAAGDPFEAKSRKSAIGASELEDKIYGAISDNISDPEKLARSRFNAEKLTGNEDHIKIGRVTVFEDVTNGLGAAVNTKVRPGYAEEEAAKQAKMQSKMASVNAQQQLQDMVKNNFGSGFVIKGKQYSPITEKGGLHPDVAANLNQGLGGSYRDQMGSPEQQAKVLGLLKKFIVRNPVQNKAAGGSIASLTDIPWMATGGAASGTDTVPAMLTPGEFVINKKSAEKIGGSALNRMNKVGKFAKGGPVGVQYLNPGGAAFGSKVASAGNIPSSSSTAKPPIDDKDTDSLKKALNDLAQESQKTGAGMLMMGGIVTSVVSQLSGMDKAFADGVTAFAGTFGTIYGIGQSLKSTGLTMAASLISEKKHKKTVEEDTGALKQHASTAAGKGDEGSKKESAYTKKLQVAAGAAESAITGFALGVAAQSAMAAYDQAKAQKEADKLDKAMERFTKSLDNEVQVRSGMINTLLLSEKAQARSNAATSQEAQAGGAIGGGIGYAVGYGATKLLSRGKASHGAADTVGNFVGTAGGLLGQTVGANSANKYDDGKVRKNANLLADTILESAKGVSAANKLMEGVDKKETSKVSEGLDKLDAGLIKAQNAIQAFDPDVLTNGSEEQKKRYLQAADSVGAFSQAVDRVAGELRGRLLKDMQAGASVGVVYNEKKLKPQLDKEETRIKKKNAAIYDPQIERAANRKGKDGKPDKTGQAEAGELKKLSEQNSNKEIAENKKLLLESSIQILNQEKALIREREAREKVIGSLVEENALRAGLEKFNQAVNQAAKGSDQIDAAFSDSVQGLKSSIPDSSVFDLEFPDPASLNAALEQVKAIGPIGEQLAGNLLDLNKVVPNLDTALERLAAKGFGDLDITKDLDKVIKEAFDVDVSSPVGKALKDMIESSYKDQKNEGGAGIIDREKIKKQFEGFAKELKEKGKSIVSAMEQADQKQRMIADKISQSEQRKLELANQGVDSYSRMNEAMAKAMGKDVPLVQKNAARFAKMMNMLGKSAGKTIPQIGKDLSNARKKLSSGNIKDPLEAAKVSSEAKNLEQALRSLADQSGRTSDTLNELEKHKAEREQVQKNLTDYAFGSDDTRAKTDETAGALNTVMQTGDLDSIEGDMREAVSGMLDSMGDFGKKVKKQLTANYFAKQGQPELAQAATAEASTPEMQLMGELQNIYAQEVKAQKELMALEDSYSQSQLAEYQKITNQLAGFNEQLAKLYSDFKAGDKKAADATGDKTPKLTTEIIDTEIKKMEAQVKTLTSNIETFNTNIGKINDKMKEIEDVKANGGKPVKPDESAKPPVAVAAQPKSQGGLIYLANGGETFKPKGTDTVPAMLTPGEFVMKKSAVDRIGADNLKAMNKGGKVSYYADGGLVDKKEQGRIDEAKDDTTRYNLAKNYAMKRRTMIENQTKKENDEAGWFGSKKKADYSELKNEEIGLKKADGKYTDKVSLLDMIEDPEKAKSHFKLNDALSKTAEEGASAREKKDEMAAADAAWKENGASLLSDFGAGFLRGFTGVPMADIIQLMLNDIPGMFGSSVKLDINDLGWGNLTEGNLFDLVADKMGINIGSTGKSFEVAGFKIDGTDIGNAIGENLNPVEVLAGGAISKIVGGAFKGMVGGAGKAIGNLKAVKGSKEFLEKMKGVAGKSSAANTMGDFSRFLTDNSVTRTLGVVPKYLISKAGQGLSWIGNKIVDVATTQIGGKTGAVGDKTFGKLFDLFYGGSAKGAAKEGAEKATQEGVTTATKEGAATTAKNVDEAAKAAKAAEVAEAAKAAKAEADFIANNKAMADAKKAKMEKADLKNLGATEAKATPSAKELAAENATMPAGTTPEEILNDLGSGTKMTKSEVAASKATMPTGTKPSEIAQDLGSGSKIVKQGDELTSPAGKINNAAAKQTDEVASLTDNAANKVDDAAKTADDMPKQSKYMASKPATRFTNSLLNKITSKKQSEEPDATVTGSEMAKPSETAATTEEVKPTQESVEPTVAAKPTETATPEKKKKRRRRRGVNPNAMMPMMGMGIPNWIQQATAQAQAAQQQNESHFYNFMNQGPQQIAGFANGGPVYLSGGGQPKGTDTVPAMLTPGEFVMNKAAVDKNGVGMMQHLNSGGDVKYLAGGGMLPMGMRQVDYEMARDEHESKKEAEAKQRAENAKRFDAKEKARAAKNAPMLNKIGAERKEKNLYNNAKAQDGKTLSMGPNSGPPTFLGDSAKRLEGPEQPIGQGRAVTPMELGSSKPAPAATASPSSEGNSNARRTLAARNARRSGSGDINVGSMANNAMVNAGQQQGPGSLNALREVAQRRESEGKPPATPAITPPAAAAGAAGAAVAAMAAPAPVVGAAASGAAGAAAAAPEAPEAPEAPRTPSTQKGGGPMRDRAIQANSAMKANRMGFQQMMMNRNRPMTRSQMMGGGGGGGVNFGNLNFNQPSMSTGEAALRSNGGESPALNAEIGQHIAEEGGTQISKGGGGGADMSSFASSVESLNKITETFSKFTETLAGITQQFSNLTVSHNVTVAGAINVQGVDAGVISTTISDALTKMVGDTIKTHLEDFKAKNITGNK